MFKYTVDDSSIIKCTGTAVEGEIVRNLCCECHDWMEGRIAMSFIEVADEVLETHSELWQKLAEV